MDVVSNSFCAGGTVLGNGTWLNVGYVFPRHMSVLMTRRGNQAIITGGASAGPQGSAAQDGDNVYSDTDGGKVRDLTARWLRSLIQQALR